MNSEKKVRLSFLGKTLISFRSDHHKSFFLWSTAIFVFCLLGGFIGLNIAKALSKEKDLVNFLSLMPFFVIGGSHLFVFFMAIKKTKFGKRSTYTFSVDCIWFNALMFAIYAILIVTFALVF